MVRMAKLNKAPSCSASFEAGRLAARRLMRLIVEKEQATQQMFRPSLAQLLLLGRSTGLDNKELTINLLQLIRTYLLIDNSV